MSFVIEAPDVVTAAAMDLEHIGSTISAASSAAAGSTTALLPAAQDEVSAAIAALFGLHGKVDLPEHIELLGRLFRAVEHGARRRC